VCLKKVKFTVEQAIDGFGGECHTLAALPMGKNRFYRRLGGPQG